jgi:hypothetical protein
MVEITIPVSVGELIDKITILQIKSLHTESYYVMQELEDLKKIAETISYRLELEKELYEINSKLWNVEDKLREKEKQQNFDLDFIELARSVYFLNDKRAEIKRHINEETKSIRKEIKCYEDTK